MRTSVSLDERAADVPREPATSPDDQVTEKRWPPALVTAASMVGLVLVLGLLKVATGAGERTDEAFVEGAEFGIWLLVATASVLVWLAVLVRGRRVLQELVRAMPEGERPRRLRDWARHLVGLAVLAVGVVTVLWSGDDPAVPIEHWRAVTGALMLVAGVAVAPWIVAIWMTHERLRTSKAHIRALAGPGDPADEEIDRLRKTWEFIERAVISVLSVVLTATLMSGALRIALVPEPLEESEFPASHVILYGAFFAFVSAVVVLPLIGSWRSKASSLVDKVRPVRSTMTEEEATARDRLISALNLDVSMIRSPLTVLSVLTPLVTGVLAVFVPQLGT